MTRVFVFTNHKGGVGKSTSATNLAFGISALLRRAKAPNCNVLLIDTDQQTHATLVTTGTSDYEKAQSLYAVLMAERREATQTFLDCIVPSEWDEHLHVLPASPALAVAERELSGVAGAPFRLAEPLEKVASQYAAVVIDTHPSFSLITEMALLAATDAIIPAEPRYLETVGLLNVMAKIVEVRDGWRHPNLLISGLLVTKMDSRIRGHRRLLEQLSNHPQLGKLLLGVIPANEAVSYAHSQHKSLFHYDPKATASKAYAQVAANLTRVVARGGH